MFYNWRVFYLVFVLLILRNGEKVCCSVFSLLREDYYLTCVTNSSSGLALITPNIESYYSKKVSEYIPNPSYNTFDCNINLNPSTCDRYWNVYPWVIKNSLEHDLDADYILDRRWEDLETISTSFVDYYLDFNTRAAQITTQDFTIPISIRTENEAHIFLCTNRNPLTSDCYWLILEGWSGDRTVFRKCRSGEIPSESKGPRGACKYYRRLITHRNNSSSKLFRGQWEHFKIVKKQNSLQFFVRRFGKTAIIDYIELEDMLPIKFLTVQTRSNRGALWKIHYIDYTSITNEDITMLGKNFRPKSKNVCVSIFVKMCSTCRMELSYEGASPSEIQTIYSPNNWKEIKYIIENYQNNDFQLKVKTISNNQQLSAKFWYIDKARLCQEEEYRILEYSNYDAPQAKCQLISNQDQIVTAGTASTDPAIPNTCPLETIGSVCFPYNLLRYTDCYRIKYCEIDSNGNTVCSCGAGYSGDNCETPCVQGSYGHSCEMTCGMCGSDCNVVDGTCSYCKREFSGKRCDIPPDATFKEPPKVIDKTYTSCTVQQVNTQLAFVELKTNLLYQVQYKKLGDSSWMSLQEVPMQNQYKFVVSDLLSETIYLFRSIIIDKDSTYNGSNVETSECKTLCKALDEKSIEVKATNISAVITLKVDEISCKTDNCAIGFTGNRAQQINETTYELSNLVPYQNYDVTLSKCGNSTTTKIRFRTIEGKPDKVKIIKVREPKAQSVTLVWQEPSNIFGDIRLYEVKYWVIRYKGCSNLIDSTIPAKVNTESTRMKIENLTPFAVYLFQIAAFTTIPGDYEIVQFETPPLDSITSSEIPQDVNISPLANSITVEIQEIACDKIRGPLYIQSMLRCIDPWCENKEASNNYEPSKPIKITDLTPFSTYELIMRICRLQKPGECSNAIRIQNTTTQPTMPNKIRDLELFFANTTALGVRWRNPYPPTGVLKDFIIILAGLNPASLTKENISLEEICPFWPQYYCYMIGKINTERNSYRIEISARNKDVSFAGESSNITSENLRKTTSETYDLNYEWTPDNNLTLSWRHPNYTYGDHITFNITIKTKGSLIPLEESINKRADEYNSTYFYIVKSTLAPSSLYEVQVLTSEQFERMTPKLSIFSPPPIPQLAEAAEVQYLNNSLLLSFSVKKEIYPLDNTTYKILITSELIPPNKPSLSNNLKLLYENKSEEHNVLMIATDFYNIPINQNNQYTVVIILINEYKNQSRSKIYYNNVGRESVTEEATGWLPFLSLLLLIPFIILLIMKRRIVCNKFIYLQQESSRILHLDPVDDNKEVIALSTNPRLSIENTQKEKPRIVAPENLMEEIYSRPVKIIDFEQYVKERVKNQEFQQQYELFSSESPIYEELDLCERRTDDNNYDHTRVVLKRHQKNEYSNCINANYIDGYIVPKAYIVTDCPQPSTLYNFWWTIWEKNTEYIIMLANIYESGKRKIEKYWPEKNKTLTVQDIVITYTCNEIYADYEKREFSVVKDSEVRKVKQLYFCSWPDDGVPLYSQSLVPFLKEILKIPLNIDTPIVIHCSVDDGIIGTVLLCDICLRMAAREGLIDVLCYLQKLRRQRANLVNNMEQYKLAHLVMLECLLGFHTNISCKELEKNVAGLLNNNKIKHQMGYLIDTAWLDQAMKKTDVENDQLPPNYHAKNRLKHVIPEYHGRISLSQILNDEQSSYINAVKVDGYRIPGRYIVTQQPMGNTLGDFWRMITEQDVSVIISLNEINLKHETSCQFWPTENGFNMNPVNYITLKFLNNTDFNCYNLTTIQVSITKKNQRRIKNIDIIWLRQWYPKKLVPNSVEEFITFWEEANTLCRMAKNVSVTCYDGVTASGIYVAISFLIEKMKLEQTCDVCQAVRTVRRNRKEFISSEVQFKFLYEVAVNYIQGFHSYANFN